MIPKILEPVQGFTKAYRNIQKLNSNITYSMFLNAIKNYKPILFRQFYEQSLSGVPSKQLKQRIKNYGN